MRRGTGAEQVPVERDRLGPEPGAFLDPGSAVLAEQDRARVRVDPIALKDLGFLAGEPDLSLGLGHESVIGGTDHTVRAGVTGLVPARGKTAYRAEPATTALSVRHHAPPADGDDCEDQGDEAEPA